MKRKVIASVLMASMCIAGAACAKAEPKESGTTVTEISVTESVPEVTEPDASADDEFETEPSRSREKAFPYMQSNFGDKVVDISLTGAETITAKIKSEDGTYDQEFASYAKGAEIKIDITAKEMQSFDYYVVFSETQGDESSTEITKGTAKVGKDGTCTITFTDEQKANGVYFVNISNESGHAFVSIAVGYTADTIDDYYTLTTDHTIVDADNGKPADEHATSADEDSHYDEDGRVTDMSAIIYRNDAVAHARHA